MEGPAVVERPRRPGPSHHSEALRMERGQVSPGNHVSGPGHPGFLGGAGILQYRRSLDGRPVLEILRATEVGRTPLITFRRICAITIPCARSISITMRRHRWIRRFGRR